MQILQVCICDALGRAGHENDAYPQADYLSRALQAAQTVDAGAIAQQCDDKESIPEKIREARVAAVAEVLGKNG